MSQAIKMVQQHLQERVSTNPRYSLRAFARDIGISPQLLSNFINAKRGLSEVTAAKIANEMQLDKRERELFLNEIRSQHARSFAVRRESKNKIQKLKSTDRVLKTHALTGDQFKVISNWYHLAILSLFRSNPAGPHTAATVSSRLNISSNEAELAISRLLKLQLIKKVQNRQQYQVMNLATEHESPQPGLAIRTFHLQVLKMLETQLQNGVVDTRYGSTVFLPLDVDQATRLKLLIHQFQEQAMSICAESFDDELTAIKPKEIYALTSHYFQVSKSNKNLSERKQRRTK